MHQRRSGTRDASLRSRGNVQNHTSTILATPQTDAASESSIEPRRPWYAEVGDLLSHAAELCVAHGIDLDSFMRGAWSAYVESRPGMREELEELHLVSQLDELRKLGRLGQA